MINLDIDQLRTFALVAELRSFTAAGDCLGASQSAISLRIAKLEQQVGRRLVARTPRAVSLTPEGARFLPHARTVLAAHDAAVTHVTADHEAPGQAPLRLAVSDHAAGARLAPALVSLGAACPWLMPDVVVGLSSEMRAAYDRGECDAAIVRADAAERRDGVPLFEDPLVWAQAVSCILDRSRPIPLVALRGPCGVKVAAIQALEEAGLPWRFAFLGGSVAALQAAVQASLGVSAFSRRHVPEGCAVAEGALPPLPPSTVVMLTRLTGTTRKAIETAFRAT
jgi:DNA-binding transcriptional LysR family regulator